MIFKTVINKLTPVSNKCSFYTLLNQSIAFLSILYYKSPVATITK